MAWELVARFLASSPRTDDVLAFINLYRVSKSIHLHLKRDALDLHLFRNAFLNRWGDLAVPSSPPPPLTSSFYRESYIDHYLTSTIDWMYYNKRKVPRKKIEAALEHWIEGNGGPQGAAYVFDPSHRPLLEKDIDSLARYINDEYLSKGFVFPGDQADPSDPSDLQISEVWKDVGKYLPLTPKEAFLVISACPWQACSYGRPMQRDKHASAIISSLSGLMATEEVELEKLRPLMNDFRWFTFVCPLVIFLSPSSPPCPTFLSPYLFLYRTPHTSPNTTAVVSTTTVISAVVRSSSFA